MLVNNYGKIVRKKIKVVISNIHSIFLNVNKNNTL